MLDFEVVFYIKFHFQNLKKNAQKIAEFCIKNGYNYSDRIHIRLWNDKEGV